MNTGRMWKRSDAGRLYECADWPRGIRPEDRAFYRVQTIGEYRPPVAGEWYVSGAIPQGYHAIHTLKWAYHIARLVRVKVVTTTIIEEVL